MKIIALMFVALNMAPELFAQSKEVYYEEMFANVEKMGGVYIPKDVEDAIRVLDTRFSEEEKDNLRKVESGLDLHFGLGMWMRNNWGLWAGSRLADYMGRCGFWHPDNMSSYIISAYLTHLKGKKPDLNLEESPQTPSEHRTVINERTFGVMEHNRETMRSKGYVQGASVVFKYPYGYSSEAEKQALLSRMREGAAPEGKIIDINYLDRTMKVKLVNSFAPEGIIIYDGNLKETVAGKYNFDRDYSKPLEPDPSILFMKPGDEIWFETPSSLWTVVK